MTFTKKIDKLISKKKQLISIGDLKQIDIFLKN